MKLKIKITKEILQRTAYCGTKDMSGIKFRLPTALTHSVSQNCAISLACQEIFPYCSVTGYTISNGERVSKGIDSSDSFWSVNLPVKARRFVKVFDESQPYVRATQLRPFEFEVELNDRVLSCINIDELKPILEHSSTLELV